MHALDPSGRSSFLPSSGSHIGIHIGSMWQRGQRVAGAFPRSNSVTNSQRCGYAGTVANADPFSWTVPRPYGARRRRAAAPRRRGTPLTTGMVVLQRPLGDSRRPDVQLPFRHLSVGAELGSHAQGGPVKLVRPRRGPALDRGAGHRVHDRVVVGAFRPPHQRLAYERRRRLLRTLFPA